MHRLPEALKCEVMDETFLSGWKQPGGLLGRDSVRCAGQGNTSLRSGKGAGARCTRLLGVQVRPRQIRQRSAKDSSFQWQHSLLGKASKLNFMKPWKIYWV